MDKECVIKNCARPAKVHGYCNSHNERLRKTGSLNENVPIRTKEKRGKLCSVKGCGRKHKSYGYCGAHSKRLRSCLETPEIGYFCDIIVVF